MVDTVQNLTGTTSSVVVPEASSAPQVTTSGAGASVEVGTNAPVAPVVDTDTQSVSVNVNSAMGDVMKAMADMPPPIDLEAVQRLRAEIAENDYPVDYEKISDALMTSLSEISE